MRSPSPAVRDRVVQGAAKAVLEPIFEADFKESSYGFRPKRSAHQGPHREHYSRAYFKKLGVYELMGTVKWYTATPTATR